jgi:hypothetical protein
MEDFQLVLPFDAAAKHLSGDHAAGQNCARSHKREGTEIETKIDEASKGAREAVERRCRKIQVVAFRLRSPSCIRHYAK